MSSYQFLASDHPFEKLENPFLERLSIREALERNMDIPAFMLENPDMDPEEKIFLLCDTEEHLEDLELHPEEISFPEVSARLTENSYVVELQWRYSKERAETLLGYIKKHLTSAENLEIFSLWLDEVDPPQRIEVTLDCLNLSHLSFLDLSEGYQGPRCLHVKNTHPALIES
ncbi:MAG TPA: hypothetical protein DEF30_07470 [Proteiniclasticum sp.]|uniref:hypothetical protein n=1 Tax=Proteiniclasticum sp. TaxID=2053595 RepID=UPI000E83C391|nr:hypothetical protein [Proteiniclasticum sp.]HBW13639.1 hypothetical protein [Proteiniclasticum sp.]